MLNVYKPIIPNTGFSKKCTIRKKWCKTIDCLTLCCVELQSCNSRNDTQLNCGSNGCLVVEICLNPTEIIMYDKQATRGFWDYDGVITKFHHFLNIKSFHFEVVSLSKTRVTRWLWTVKLIVVVVEKSTKHIIKAVIFWTWMLL